MTVLISPSCRFARFLRNGLVLLSGNERFAMIKIYNNGPILSLANSPSIFSASGSTVLLSRP